MDQKLIQDDVDSYGSTDSVDDIHSLDFETVVKNIYTTNSNCRFLEQASKAIGTTKDNIKLRNNVQSTLFDCKTLIDQTKIKLHELVITSKKEDKTYKLRLEKLKNNFKDSVQIYSNLQQVLLIKLRRNLPSEPCPITHNEHKRVDYIYDDEEELLSLQQSYQKTVEDQEEIIEREDAIRKIENDVLDINDIMRDLGTMIQSQGDTIDLIENVVEDSHGTIESGREELEKAAEYMNKRRRKILFLSIILFIIICSLAIILYFTLKKT